MATSTPTPTNYPPGYLTEDRAPEIITMLTALGIVATLALIGRLIARRIVHKPLSASDIFVILGLLGTWAISAINIYRTIYLTIPLFICSFEMLT
jgi:hypothetical protein